MVALKLALPWLFLFVGIWASVLIINGTARAACDELPDAFRHGKHTEVTDRSTGAKVEKTEINCRGLTFALASLLVGRSPGRFPRVAKPGFRRTDLPSIGLG